jgi:nucleoside 2-deoxyribosyltransferase
MKVYLCGPINGCTDEECKDWREMVKARLPDTLDPMRRDYRGREVECVNEIVEGDKEDIRECDVFLVNYDRPSVGTSMEVLLAWQQDKPVIVVHKPDAVISPWLRYHSTKFFTSFDDAIKQIEDWS